MLTKIFKVFRNKNTRPDDFEYGMTTKIASSSYKPYTTTFKKN